VEKLKKWLNKLFEAFKASGIPFILGFLGSYAGSEGTSKNWRRVDIPLIFMLCALCKLHNLWVISIMFMSFALSMGYGETSFLRKFFKGNNYLTRGVIGLVISLSFLVIPILKGNWFFYLLGSVGIISIWATLTWRDFGTIIIKWKNKTYYLLKVDFICYSLLGTIGLFIIYKG